MPPSNAACRDHHIVNCHPPPLCPQHISSTRCIHQSLQLHQKKHRNLKRHLISPQAYRRLSLDKITMLRCHQTPLLSITSISKRRHPKKIKNRPGLRPQEKVSYPFCQHHQPYTDTLSDKAIPRSPPTTRSPTTHFLHTRCLNITADESFQRNHTSSSNSYSVIDQELLLVGMVYWYG